MNAPVSHLGYGQLNVTLHRDGLRGLLRPAVPVRCVEFSIDNMCVESEHEFAPGDRVIIDLSLDDVCMHELDGAIFEAKPEGNGFLYRVEFLYRNRRRTHSAEIVHCLRLIEDHLRHAVI